MPMLRLLTFGLCAANVVMLATWEPVRVEVRPVASAVSRAPDRPGDRMARLRRAGGEPVSGFLDPRRVPPVHVVDVARSVAPSTLAALEALAMVRPDEQITAINDRQLMYDVETDAVIASLAPRAGGYLDLTVSSAVSERRVLVLLH